MVDPQICLVAATPCLNTVLWVPCLDLEASAVDKVTWEVCPAAAVEDLRVDVEDPHVAPCPPAWPPEP